MDNESIKPKPPVKKANFTIWIVLGAIIVIVLAFGGYYLYSQRAGNKNTNTVSQTNINANINESENLNNNLNLNVNQAVNGNTNTSVAKTGWQLITYQRADHGFTFQLPENWTTWGGWNGFRETDPLAGAHLADNDKYLDLTLNYFVNTEPSFETWLAKRKEAISKDETIINEQIKTINGSEAAVIDTQYDYVISGGGIYLKVYAFVPRGDKIYKLEASGKKDFFESQSQGVDGIIESFKFIDVKPIAEINTISYGQKISSNLAYNLEVDWLAEPLSINMKEPSLLKSDSGVMNRDYYQVGTITNGRYKDKKLLDIFETPDGPAFYPDLYRVVYDEESRTFTYLEKLSATLSDYVKENFAYDTGSTISSLSGMPAEISIPDSQIKLAAEAYSLNGRFSSYENLELLFTDTTAGKVYFDSVKKCFLIETPDSLVKLYYLKLDFVSNFTPPEYSSSTISLIPAVTWTDGSKVTKEYTYSEPTGCGSSYCQSLFTAEELGGADVLQVAGKTSAGDNVYEYKDKNAQLLQDTYKEYGVPYQGEKVGYEQFISGHPVFYWPDPFGRYLRFKKSEFLPMVECAKPVIYLYPEKTEKIRVEVAPNGGFSETIPTYPDDGWLVTASPAGELLAEDGGIYPYLFWEGFGFNYKIPDRGFIVAKKDVGVFLSEKLIALGLNEKEVGEFKDFWLPKMSEKPYYFITFVDQNVFNELAPLKVTPQPDRIIRVFMDYKPLDAPISVEPLEISTPERSGFTVVEWGGALHR
ncbi:MAG: hypothetical protein WC528_01790 [Patescibacteria group bacterium]